METSEHRLMIHMFQQQMMVIKSLIETLKSQGFVQGGDLEAYDALVCSSESVRSEIESQVAKDYREAALTCGVKNLPAA